MAKWAAGCCFALALVLPIVLIVVGEIALPRVIAARLNELQHGHNVPWIALTASPCRPPTAPGAHSSLPRATP